MTKTVTGIFKTSISARETLYKLEMSGISQDQINVIAADDAVQDSFGIERDNKAAEGIAIGGAAGGLLGAIAGGLAATGAIAIPGLNLLVFGALITAAAGAGAGATVGGLTGALIGLGIPEYEIKHFENEVKGGSVLLAVEARNDEQADLIKDIFENQNADKIAA